MACEVFDKMLLLLPTTPHKHAHTGTCASATPDEQSKWSSVSWTESNCLGKRRKYFGEFKGLKRIREEVAICERRMLAEHFKSLRQRFLFVLLYVRKTSPISPHNSCRKKSAFAFGIVLEGMRIKKC